MKVAAYDPFLSEERAQDLGVAKVELDELFRRADFISLHTPMTDQTRGIIDAAAIAKMKNGVRIINCARGGLVVEEDLKKALDDGTAGGAAMDVFVEEPARGKRPVRSREGGGHAASGRLDGRSPGQRGDPGRRADGRLSAHRLGDQRPQHAVGERRGCAQAQSLHEARRAARQLRRPGDGDRHQGGDHRVLRHRLGAQYPAADRGGAEGTAHAAPWIRSTWYRPR